MVDNHGTRIGNRACVGNLAADQRLQRAIGADGVGQDLAGRGSILRIDQVDVLGAGVDIAELQCAGRDGSILRQGQLAVAVRVYENRLGLGSVALPLPFLNGVDIRVAGNYEEIDGCAAHRKIARLVPLAFFTVWLVISESRPYWGQC